MFRTVYTPKFIIYFTRDRQLSIFWSWQICSTSNQLSVMSNINIIFVYIQYS